MSDLISRQDAIDALGEEPEVWIDDDEYAKGMNAQWKYDRKAIEALPSAERKGKWLEMGTNKDGTHNIKCSKCGEGYKTRGHARSIATKAKYKFCPNCGASMEGRGEEDA